MNRWDLFLLLLVRIKRRQGIKLVAIIVQIALGVFIMILSISFLSHYCECKEYFENKYGKNTYILSKYNTRYSNLFFTLNDLENIKNTPGIKISQPLYSSGSMNIEEKILLQLFENSILLPEQQNSVQVKLVDSRYFSFFSIGLISGRVFQEEDIYGRNRVIIISKDAANRIFQSTDVAGRSISLGVLGEFQIIGVVENQYTGFDFESEVLNLYFPYSSFLSNDNSVRQVLIKGNETNDANHKMANIKMDINNYMGNSIIGIDFYSNNITQTLESFKINASILLFFGFILLFISLIGNIGVALAVFYNRLNIYGIELIIGAEYVDIAFQIFLENFLTYFAGSWIGLLFSIPLRSLLSSMDSFYRGTNLSFGIVLLVFVITFLLAAVSSSVIVIQLYHRKLAEIIA